MTSWLLWDRFGVKSLCLLSLALKSGEEDHCVSLKDSVMSHDSLIQCALYEDIASSIPWNNYPLHISSPLVTHLQPSFWMISPCPEQSWWWHSKRKPFWGTGVRVGRGGRLCHDCDVTGKMPLSGLGRERPGALSAWVHLIWQLQQLLSFFIACSIMKLCVKCPQKISLETASPLEIIENHPPSHFCALKILAAAALSNSKPLLPFACL